MTVDILDWNQAAVSHSAEWQRLVAAGELNPSLLPGWMSITLDTHDLLESARVLIIRTPAGDSAIIPVLIRQQVISGIPMRCMDLCSNTLSYHAEVLSNGQLEPVLEQLVNSKALPWDVLRLDNLPVQGPTFTTIERMARAQQLRVLTYSGQTSPYLSLSGEWSSYTAQLSKKMRANISRCMRTVEQAGVAEMRWYSRDSDTDALFKDILEIESRSWKAGENTAVRADNLEGRYHALLLPWLAQHELMANVLFVDHRPVAYTLCVKWGKWIGQLKTSFSQDVRDAGFRVIQASIERAFSTGADEYDFLGDAAPHKMRWTSLLRQHTNCWIFASHWRGRSAYHAKRLIDRVRNKAPAAKTLSHHGPE